MVVEPRDVMGAAPLTSLAVVPGKAMGPTWLIAGDTAGGLRTWKVQAADPTTRTNTATESASSSSSSPALSIQEHSYVRLTTPDGASCSIVCMEVTRDGKLVVATDTNSNSAIPLASGDKASIPFTRAVYVIDMKLAHVPTVPDENGKITIVKALNGHVKDSVQCILPLPNGDLLTAGGKHDATLQLWKANQMQQPQGSRPPEDENSDTAIIEDGEDSIKIETKCFKRFEELGYVFALTCLPDMLSESNNNNKSQYMAVAAARYNQVKVLL